MIFLVMFYQVGDYGEAHVISAHRTLPTAQLAIAHRAVKTGNSIHDYYVAELEIA